MSPKARVLDLAQNVAGMGDREFVRECFIHYLAGPQWLTPCSVDCWHAGCPSSGPTEAWFSRRERQGMNMAKLI